METIFSMVLLDKELGCEQVIPLAAVVTFLGVAIHQMSIPFPSGASTGKELSWSWENACSKAAVAIWRNPGPCSYMHASSLPCIPLLSYFIKICS